MLPVACTPELVVTTIIEKLKTKRMYGEAATLLESYAEQPEEAIATLIDGSLWDESLRLVSNCNCLLVCCPSDNFFALIDISH